MSLHLADVAPAVAPGAHAALLMDRAGWHCAKDLVVPDNLTLVLLPARAPELNPVETIWQFVRANWLSSRVFGSYTDLVDHGCYAWNLCVEPPYRPTLDHHVQRPPRLGQCMILNAGWYYRQIGPVCRDGARPSGYRGLVHKARDHLLAG